MKLPRLVIFALDGCPLLDTPENRELVLAEAEAATALWTRIRQGPKSSTIPLLVHSDV